MRLLTHTNIVVDDFELCKDYQPGTFIHFLTHFHADHWQGLTPLWNFGPIFCSLITKRFILNKFPKLDRVHELELDQIYRLDLLEQRILLEHEPSRQYTIEVSLIDANHIPGSVMYLFKGFMGTILHTGDFRFEKRMLQNQFLFPNGKAVQIDEMIFDNTYCDPMFNFPTADVVAEQMVRIIEKNKGKRVFISMGALGKEKIVLRMCKEFQTKIVVTEQKFLQMVAGRCPNLELFTFNEKEGFIRIIGKHNRQEILAEEGSKCDQVDFICISTDFLMLEHRNPDQINYIVPYSLHSNFQEMKEFIEALRPAILRQKLVVPFENFAQYRRKVRINPVKAFRGYIKRLEQNGESGYSQLIRSSTDFTKVSKEYLQWMYPEKSRALLLSLGLQLEPDRKNRKRKVDQQEPKMSLKEQIEELEKQWIYAPRPPKAEGLDQIAQKLRATHNNLQITQFLKKPVDEETQRRIQFWDASDFKQDINKLLNDFINDKDN